jgi:hypothetical protein
MTLSSQITKGTLQYALLKAALKQKSLSKVVQYLLDSIGSFFKKTLSQYYVEWQIQIIFLW